MVQVQSAIRWVSLLTVMFMEPSLLRAEDPPIDTFRLTDPAMVDPSSNGWRVDPRTGKLSAAIFLATMPGELSFPVSLTLDLTPVVKRRKVITGYESRGADGRDAPQYGMAVTTIPVHSSINLGSISEATGSLRYTLEDGRVYRDSDFVKTQIPFHQRMSRADQLLRAYGLSAGPGDPNMTSCMASSDGSLVLANFGYSWTGPISTAFSFSANSFPMPLFSYRGLGSGSFGYGGRYYVVLMDKNRLRVHVALPVVLTVNYGHGEYSSTRVGTQYFPILIADRFGHYVAMRWSHNGHVQRVDVRNQRGQGFTMRMDPWPHSDGSNTLRDIARLDFVNMSAPSMVVKGYPAQASAMSTSGSGNRMLYPPNLMGQPTSITIGNPESLPQPSWSGVSGAASDPPITLPSMSVATRTWTVEYGTSLVKLNSPTGLQSEFLTTIYPIVQPVNAFEGTYTPSQPDNITGVYQVNQADLSGKSSAVRTITWDRRIHQQPAYNPSVSAISITHSDLWDQGTIPTADRHEKYNYGDANNPSGQATNPTDFGNGFLTRWALAGTDGTEWASVDRASFTNKISNGSSSGSGFSYFNSALRQIIQTCVGTLSVQRTHVPWDDTAIQTKLTTISVRGDSSDPWMKVQDCAIDYNNRWAMAEPHQVCRTETTRYRAGAALSPVNVMASVWDTVDPPRLELQSTYQDAGNLRHGANYAYDSEGRLTTKNIHHVEGGTSLPSPNTLTISYDTATTGLPTQWSTVYQDAGGTSSVTKSQGDFDHSFRPQLATDEKGVSTRTNCDLYGRPVAVAKDGEAPISISYPDEWTRISTQAGKTTTESYDAFGRLVETVLPDGRVVIPTYDLHNRVVMMTETNKGGVTRTCTTTYDLLDRVVSETSFTGRRVDYAYTADGLHNVVTRTVDPGGLNLVTETRTDPFGQVVSVKAPNGDRTEYAYDGLGQQTQATITPAGGGPPQVRTFAYDALGRLVRKTEPETGTQTFSDFNALNQAQTLIERGIDPAKPARTRTLAYDGLGRLRAQLGEGAVETFDYLNAFLARTIRITDGDAVTQAFVYDGPGKRLSQESTTLSVEGLR